MEKRKPLLRIENIKKHFPVQKGVFKRTFAHVKAVDGVSLEVFQGETLGLVGESGCGKSTLGMSILRLFDPTAGKIFFEDIDTTPLFMSGMRAKNYINNHYVQRFKILIKEFKTEDMILEHLETAADRNYAALYLKKGTSGLMEEFFTRGNEKKKYFRKNAQIIFQDPYSSLNPRMKIKDIIAEGLFINNIKNIEEIVSGLLDKVGLSNEYLTRYPHQFSGGQRQRIGIARALALKPKMIIADEAVSALDVSVRAQILNLLSDLQKEFDLTYIFISHDLSLVKHLSNRIAVMYLGKISESAGSDELFKKPLHPYTVSLMSANPVPDPEIKKNRVILKGDVPSPLNPPPGCSFHPRCPIAKIGICDIITPPLLEIEKDHLVSCHYAGQFKP